MSRTWRPNRQTFRPNKAHLRQRQCAICVLWMWERSFSSLYSSIRVWTTAIIICMRKWQHFPRSTCHCKLNRALVHRHSALPLWLDHSLFFRSRSLRSFHDYHDYHCHHIHKYIAKWLEWECSRLSFAATVAPSNYIDRLSSISERLSSTLDSSFRRVLCVSCFFSFTFSFSRSKRNTNNNNNNHKIY